MSKRSLPNAKLFPTSKMPKNSKTNHQWLADTSNSFKAVGWCSKFMRFSMYRSRLQKNSTSNQWSTNFYDAIDAQKLSKIPPLINYNLINYFYRNIFIEIYESVDEAHENFICLIRILSHRYTPCLEPKSSDDTIQPNTKLVILKLLSADQTMYFFRFTFRQYDA